MGIIYIVRSVCVRKKKIFKILMTFYKMSSKCNGCILECECECLLDDYNSCTCIHSTHEYGYCPTECKECKMVECPNFRLCNKKIPKYLAECFEDKCIDCAIYLGKYENTDIIDECCVCYENKIMIKLGKCNHLICLDCWYRVNKLDVNKLDVNKLDEDEEEDELFANNKCVLCRRVNDFSL
jgi:hypothetical protein